MGQQIQTQTEATSAMFDKFIKDALKEVKDLEYRAHVTKGDPREGVCPSSPRHGGWVSLI